jgi:beta-lactamase class A
MRMNLKSKTKRTNRGNVRLVVVFLVTTIFASIILLLYSNQITTNIPVLFGFPGFSRQATVATNGADQWDNDDMVTAPIANFSPLSSNTLSVSPLFARAYQIYGTSHNNLGAPITAAFPTTDGWLQFFANGALLLPSTQIHNNDTSLSTLAKNGVYDTATGVVRLPLVQTLVSTGSTLPVGGPGSTLTYVDLRKATSPTLMSPIPASTNTHTNLSSTLRTTTPQGVFIQGGRRGGRAVGHLIPTVFWNYINQPDISPHSWEKDFGDPLTEALTFTLPVNGQTHHMLIQVFSQQALILDQDAGEVQEAKQTQEVEASPSMGPAHPAPTASANDATGQPAIQLLPTSADYLSTVGMPTVTIPAQKTVWTQSDTALLNTPGTGQQIAHIGQNFPLTLLGDTSWMGGIPWYHIQWSVPKQNQKGWIAATALTFNSPGNVASTASIDALSAKLSSYLTNLGSNAGVAAYDLTRRRTYTYNSSIQFITASSMKVPIMLTFLDTMEQQGREPNDDEMGRLTTMIENSDNDAATALFNEIGDAAGITAYMQKLGLNGLIADDDAWGYSTITPQTMVDLLTLLYNGKILNRNHRTLALHLMENVESDQQVGVGDTAPNNAIVALKDGWVTSDDDTWAMNSSGIVTIGNETYIIAVYTQELGTLEDGEGIARKVCGSVASLLAP